MNKTINKQNNTTTACRLTKINTNFCLAALLIRTSCCYPENQVKSTICGKVKFTHEYLFKQYFTYHQFYTSE